jgi:copper resistance protein B
MRTLLIAAVAAGALAAPPALAADAASPNSFFLSRTDVGVSTRGETDYDWDAQGWIGGDENRLWVKSSGTLGRGPDRADVQVLYSHAVSEFWDVQAGVRQAVEPSSRSYGVLGVQGLAPYWFEIDAAAFLSDRGRVSARLEGSYELTLTQRIFAEPYGVVRAGATKDAKLLEGSGITDTEAGLRVRYEFSRKVAPYVGVAWTHRYGETARLWKAAGGEAYETSLRMGVRLLF